MSSNAAVVHHRVPRRLPASMRWGSLQRLPHRYGGDDLRLTVFAPDEELSTRSPVERRAVAAVGAAGTVLVLVAAVLQAWVLVLVAAGATLTVVWGAVAARYRAQRHFVRVDVWRVGPHATLADVRDYATVIAIAHRLDRAAEAVRADRISREEYLAIWRREYTHVTTVRSRNW